MKLIASIRRKDWESIVIHTNPPIEIQLRPSRRGNKELAVICEQILLVDRKETLTDQMQH